jgi:hypothetical protein
VATATGESATRKESESVNARQLEQCTTIRTELEGFSRMTPALAHERTQDPRELARWRDSALSILNRADALVDVLRGELKGDPEAVRQADLLLRFDRAKVKAGVRAILDIVLARAERETRILIDESLSEAAAHCRIALTNVERFDTLRAAAESAGGPFPGVKCKLSPELRKALTILAQGRL